MPEPLNKDVLIETLKQPGALLEVIDLVEELSGINLNPDIPIRSRWLSVKQFAYLVDMDAQTIRRWIDEGLIQADYFGNRVIRVQVQRALRDIKRTYQPRTRYAERNRENIEKLNQQNKEKKLKKQGENK